MKELTLWEEWIAQSRDKRLDIAQGAMVAVKANSIDVPQYRRPRD